MQVMQTCNPIQAIDDGQVFNAIDIVPLRLQHGNGPCDGGSLAVLIIFDCSECLVDGFEFLWISQQWKHDHGGWFGRRVEGIETSEELSVLLLHVLIAPILFATVQRRLPWSVLSCPCLVVIKNAFCVHRIVKLISPTFRHRLGLISCRATKVRRSFLEGTG